MATSGTASHHPQHTMALQSNTLFCLPPSPSSDMHTPAIRHDFSSKFCEFHIPSDTGFHLRSPEQYNSAQKFQCGNMNRISLYKHMFYVMSANNASAVGVCVCVYVRFRTTKLCISCFLRLFLLFTCYFFLLFFFDACALFKIKSKKSFCFRWRWKKAKNNNNNNKDTTCVERDTTQNKIPYRKSVDKGRRREEWWLRSKKQNGDRNR